MHRTSYWFVTQCYYPATFYWFIWYANKLLLRYVDYNTLYVKDDLGFTKLCG